MTDATRQAAVHSTPAVPSEELHFLELKLTVACPSCSRENPIPEMIPVARCYACDARVPTKSIWHHVNLQDDIAALFSGREKHLAHGRLDVRIGSPSCSCGHALPDLAEAVAASQPESRLTCPKCQGTTVVRAASDQTRSLANIPEITHVVSPVPHIHGASERKTVTLKCANCGAPLTSDGSSRIVQCDYCHASEELPPELWDPKGPHLEPVPFFLVVKPAPRLLMEQRYRATSVEERVRDAQDPSTPPEALEFLATMHKPSNIDLLVAKNPAAPEPLLVSLAKSKHEEVRLAILERFEREGGAPALDAALAPVREERALARKRAGVQDPLGARGQVGATAVGNGVEAPPAVNDQSAAAMGAPAPGRRWIAPVVFAALLLVAALFALLHEVGATH